MTHTAAEVRELAGITSNQLDYLARQPCVQAFPLQENWSDTATAQAILYGFLHRAGHPGYNDSVFLAACNALRLIDWSADLDGVPGYLVIGPSVLGIAVALVHDPEDALPLGAVLTRIALSDIVVLLTEVGSAP